MRKFLLAACAAASVAGAAGAAHAAGIGGTYQVTFTTAYGNQVTYCAVLTSLGAAGPYRDSGFMALTTGNTVVATGTYVTWQQHIYSAVSNGAETLTGTGAFTHPGVAQTASIDMLTGGGLILAPATWTETRNKNCTAQGTTAGKILPH